MQLFCWLLIDRLVLKGRSSVSGSYLRKMLLICLRM